MYTIIMQIKNIGHHARLREDDMYFAAEVSLREISFVVYVHALICARNDAKIVRSRDAQCNTEESP